MEVYAIAHMLIHLIELAAAWYNIV